MSPVEICGMAKRSAMKPAWVPLPAPGGPTRTSRTRVSPVRSAVRAPGPTGRVDAAPLTQEPFVVALHQLALDLLDRVQRHADHDQHRGAAEREVLVVATG